MQKVLMSLVLFGFIIFELQYFGLFNLSHCIQSTLYAVRRSENYLFVLFLSLGLIIAALCYLKYKKSSITDQRVAYTFNKKKNLSEFKREVIKETRRNVDALLSSEAYKRHKQQFKTSEDFANQRDFYSDDEVSLDYDDSVNK